MLLFCSAIRSSESSQKGTRSMKHIVIVRHGDYGEGGVLSPKGTRDIGDIADQLCSLVALPVAVFTSDVPRTLQSAAILGTALGASAIQRKRVLYSDRENKPRCSEVIPFILGEQGVQTVVVVTHFEYGYSLYWEFAQRIWGFIPARGELNKGEAWVVEPAALRIDKLKPRVAA
jgi:phosphohistidine phosphatase SixA